MEAWRQSLTQQWEKPYANKDSQNTPKLCAVYGWEVVNNHVRSGRSMDNPVTQTTVPAERFDLRHPCHAQEFLLTLDLELQVYSFSERTGGEQPPIESEV